MEFTPSRDATALDERPAPDLLAMDNQEFVTLIEQFFGEVSPNSACTVCANESMVVTRYVGDRSYHGLATKRWNDYVDGVVFMYAVCCDRCGYVMLHNYDAVEKWRMARGLVQK